MRTFLICMALASTAACNKANTPAAASDTDLATSRHAIEKAQKDQIAAVGQKYVGGATEVYSDDALFIDQDGKLVSGKEAIRSGFKQSLDGPDRIKIDYKPGAIIFSNSGDMAYSTASFTETVADAYGRNSRTIKGTNLSVWKKQSDGSWELVADSNPGARTAAK